MKSKLIFLFILILTTSCASIDSIKKNPACVVWKDQKYLGPYSTEVSEKEASSLLSQMQSIEETLFTLQKKFTKDLQEIMSDKKIMKLKKAEGDFNRHLLKQMREKHKG